jgi:S-DNA-T family DNA segregation ATPase FtsK/SpoIIIE
MTMDTLNEYLKGFEKPAQGDYASLLRLTLRELLHMATPVVQPIEDRIEQEKERALSAAEERFVQDQQEIELYRRAQLEEAKGRLDSYARTVRQEYDQKVETIETQARRKREAANKAADTVQKRAEVERRERLMEVDFLADGGAERIQQGRRQTEDAHASRQQELAALRERWNACLHRYRQAALSDDAPVSPDEADITPEEYEPQLQTLQMQAQQLERVLSARLLERWHPYVWAALLVTSLVVLALTQGPATLAPGIRAGLAGLLGLLLTGTAVWFLRRRARQVCSRLSDAFRTAWSAAQEAANRRYRGALQRLEEQVAQTQADQKAEADKIEQACQATIQKALQTQEQALAALEEARKKALKQQMQRHNQAVNEAQQEYQQRKAMLDDQYRQDLAGFEKKREQDLAAALSTYQEDRTHLEARWDQGIGLLQHLLRDLDTRQEILAANWRLVGTSSSAGFPVVRFGSLRVDLDALAPSVRERLGVDLPTVQDWPAVLAFPDRCSLLLQSGREGRDRALDTLRAVMVRLFTTLPPGQVRFTIIDPVGLGESFAGFMHAGDYLESLVGGRIWTEAPQIQQQLEELTGHMENVIQKYLRNEFESIEQYNQQAGELAEPYRFLVIADFPTNVSEESARRLSSILHSGPRCGVHTLIALDERQDLPAGIDLEDLRAHSLVLHHENDHYVWQDSVLKSFPLDLDVPPDEAALTEMMHAVGRAGADSARVEVAFEAIAPDDTHFWSADSRKDIRVALGRTGATRLQYLHLGRGMAQHMLIAGKTGSGKSTLLHVMITNLALWYRPEEVELYLIDFKKGVEFKCYVTHRLPHARAVAIESDREFGLSILQRLDAEMTRRGELFRQAGVQDIAGYRDQTDTALPRAVLMVDEFQVFFGEDDKLSQDASILLEQLVRQGRAFGIHVILGSQTLGGAFGLARSTMGQMAVRIALQCSEADSQLILDDDNVAARLLSRPGEAIYNDAGGQMVGNSPFQTAWLADSTRDAYLEKINAQLQTEAAPAYPMIVFEGSAPAEIGENRLLAACLAASEPDRQPPRIWLGDPVAIKDPTAAMLRRQSGANLLMVGQRDDMALNLMSAGLAGLAGQLDPQQSRFVILDGSPPDTAQAGVLAQVTEALPHTTEMVPWRDVADKVIDLAAEVERRMEADERDVQTLFLVVYGLQRYRMLRRSEDSFSLSMDPDAAPQADARFADLLRDGPAVGVHVWVWADTLASVERTLDRQSLREFDYRVLFQMSATDSSNLIDSPVANQLGFHRALLYSEEQGGVERFRPYGPLKPEWLEQLAQQLRA